MRDGSPIMSMAVAASVLLLARCSSTNLPFQAFSVPWLRKVRGCSGSSDHGTLVSPAATEARRKNFRAAHQRRGVDASGVEQASRCRGASRAGCENRASRSGPREYQQDGNSGRKQPVMKVCVRATVLSITIQRCRTHAQLPLSSPRSWTRL